VIRACTYEDLPEIARLHELYFGDQFNMPDLMSYICAFIIEDEQGIILAGGVRDIAECTAITDQSRKPIIRAAALHHLLDASTFVCREQGYEEMYAWSQDPKYSKRLTKNGFRYHAGQSLIYDL
jgi:N-acetylglutamate synthase-like GNAT family acetyltransferase